MATKRKIIIDALETLLENPAYSLGLTSVTKHVEMIPMTAENFPNFPLGHIVDRNEVLQYFPGRRIESKIDPIIRLFYTTAGYDALDAVEEKLKIMFASGSGFPLGITPKWTRVKSIRTIKEPNHTFVELQVQLEIVFTYIDGSP